MAKQTIIVMSDFTEIVDCRRNTTAILEKSMLSHDGDSNFAQIQHLGSNHSQEETWIYSDYPERLVTQLGPTKIIQTHG